MLALRIIATVLLGLRVLVEITGHNDNKQPALDWVSVLVIVAVWLI